MRICKITKCNKIHYAHGWCNKHYVKWWKWGNPHYIHQRIYKVKYIKCIIQGCNKFHKTKGYCIKHYARWRRHKNPLIVLKPSGRNIKGKLNPNWKGGIADYPNHAFMKKQRLIVLIRNPKCEKCGKLATEIHHRNGNKADHRLRNLMASCHSCNTSIRFKPNNSKYRRKYGKNLEELGKEYNMKGSTIAFRLKHNVPLSRPKWERIKEIC